MDHFQFQEGREEGSSVESTDPNVSTIPEDQDERHHNNLGVTGMTIEDKLDLWKKSEIPPQDLDPVPEDLDPVPEDEYSPKLDPYHEALIPSPAYQWFLGNLKRDVHMIPTGPDTMGDIKCEVMSHLKQPVKASRRAPPKLFRVVLELDWRPSDFFREQEYKEKPKDVVDIAITLTGSSYNAQALRCADYMRQTWPSSGQDTMRLVRNVLDNEPGKMSKGKSELLVRYSPANYM